MCIYTDDIIYVESNDHKILWHTTKGTYSSWGTISELAEVFGSDKFLFCNRGQIVNVQYIKKIVKNTIILQLSEDTLQISRSMKKGFIDKLTVVL